MSEEFISFRDIVNFDLFFQVYVILTILDFVTGFLKAFKTEGFKSRKIRDGVIRVLGEIAAIFFGGVLATLVDMRLIIISIKVLFIFKEAVSISENLGAVGVYIPSFILEHLEEFKNKYTPKEKEEE